MWCICTVEAHSAKTKSEILPFAATGMDLEGIMLSGMSQPQKDKHCVIHLHEGLSPRPGNFHMPRVQPKKIVSHKVNYKWNENENTT